MVLLENTLMQPLSAADGGPGTKGSGWPLLLGRRQETLGLVPLLLLSEGLGDGQGPPVFGNSLPDERGETSGLLGSLARVEQHTCYHLLWDKNGLACLGFSVAEGMQTSPMHSLSEGVRLCQGVLQILMPLPPPFYLSESIMVIC